MDEMTEVTSGAASRSVVEAAWDRPIVSWVDVLRAHLLEHQFSLFILLLEVQYQFLDEGYGIVVAHRACAPLGYHL